MQMNRMKQNKNSFEINMIKKTSQMFCPFLFAKL